MARSPRVHLIRSRPLGVGAARSWRRPITVAAALCLALAAVVSGAPAFESSRDGDDAAIAELPAFSAACSSDNPYFIAACYSDGDRGRDDERALVAFRDTAGDSPHFKVATQGQVGTTWGLAHSAAENAVYAAAYHKRGAAFGPGGPGAVYRVDLATGATSTIVVVPNAGPDRHDSNLQLDRGAIKWVGRTSLGDIDLDGSGGLLYVTNLNDRRIYRIAVPSGQVIGSFLHGAAAEPWAAEARPFGLGVADGIVYHGVVRSAEESRRRADLAMYVYASQPDGTGLRQVAALDLDYPRGAIELPVIYCDGRPSVFGCWSVSAALRWNAWRDDERELHPNSFFAAYPMPILSDITLDDQGFLTVALRDRQVDVTLPKLAGQTGYRGRGGIGIGDVHRGEPDGNSWVLSASPHFYDDALSSATHTALGGLAQSSVIDVLMATALGERYFNWSRFPRPNGGTVWFSGTSGQKLSRELVCNEPALEARTGRHGVAFAHNEGFVASDIGDIEELCGVVPSPTPTAVPASATPTETATTRPSATAIPTSTSATSPTLPPPSATPEPSSTPASTPCYLPIALAELCDPVHERSDVALVVDTSSSMTGLKMDDAKAAALTFVDLIDLAPGRSQVAVVRYDREAEVVRELTRSRTLVEAAIGSLQVRSHTHIDKGLRAALGELQSPRHNERNSPVMVLLTDGLQTGTPGEELRAATEVRDAGVRLYTIGLGADVDEAALKAMAGDESRYYHAPDSGDLARIYAEIAQDLVCPGKELWGGR